MSIERELLAKREMLQQEAHKKYDELDIIHQRICETNAEIENCLLYTSPSPRDRQRSRMPSSA